MSFGSHAFHILKYFGTSIETVRLNLIIMEKEAILMEATAKSPRRLTLLLTLLLAPEEKLRSEDTRRIRQPTWQTGRSSCLIDWKRSELSSGWLCVHPHAALGRFSHLPNFSQSFLQPNVKRNCFSSQITYQARLVRSRRI